MKNSHYFYIGSFVLGASLLFVIGLIVFGGGRLFSQNVPLVLYFEGSVAGLNVGSPVNFRGVQIGKVTDIMVNIDNKNLDIHIPVHIDIDSDRITEVGETKYALSDSQTLAELIDKGLRAQLNLQSLVTGRLNIELDFHPDKEAILIKDNANILQIPTIPSELQQLSKTIEKIPLEELISQSLETIQSINKALDSDTVTNVMNTLNQSLTSLEELVSLMKHEIPSVLSKTSTSLDNANKLFVSLNSEVPLFMDNAQHSLKLANESLISAKNLMGNLEQVTQQHSPVTMRITTALDEMTKAARSIRSLSDYLQRHPESILTGKKN